MNKKTNNDLQNTTQKTKDRAMRIPLRLCRKVNISTLMVFRKPKKKIRYFILHTNTKYTKRTSVQINIYNTI